MHYRPCFWSCAASRVASTCPSTRGHARRFPSLYPRLMPGVPGMLTPINMVVAAHMAVLPALVLGACVLFGIVTGWIAVEMLPVTLGNHTTLAWAVSVFATSLSLLTSWAVLFVAGWLVCMLIPCLVFSLIGWAAIWLLLAYAFYWLALPAADGPLTLWTNVWVTLPACALLLFAVVGLPSLASVRRPLSRNVFSATAMLSCVLLAYGLLCELALLLNGLPPEQRLVPTCIAVLALLVPVSLVIAARTRRFPHPVVGLVLALLIGVVMVSLRLKYSGPLRGLSVETVCGLPFLCCLPMPAVLFHVRWVGTHWYDEPRRPEHASARTDEGGCLGTVATRARGVLQGNVGQYCGPDDPHGMVFIEAHQPWDSLVDSTEVIRICSLGPLLWASYPLLRVCPFARVPGGGKRRQKPVPHHSPVAVADAPRRVRRRLFAGRLGLLLSLAVLFGGAYSLLGLTQGGANCLPLYSLVVSLGPALSLGFVVDWLLIRASVSRRMRMSLVVSLSFLLFAGVFTGILCNHSSSVASYAIGSLGFSTLLVMLAIGVALSFDRLAWLSRLPISFDSIERLFRRRRRFRDGFMAHAWYEWHRHGLLGPGCYMAILTAVLFPIVCWSSTETLHPMISPFLLGSSPNVANALSSLLLVVCGLAGYLFLFDRGEACRHTQALYPRLMPGAPGMLTPISMVITAYMTVLPTLALSACVLVWSASLAAGSTWRCCP